MSTTDVFAGDEVFADDVNHLTIRGRIRQSSSGLQTGITDNTITAVTFDTEDVDTNNFHSTSSNTSRVTPTVAGDYQVWGTVALQGQTDYLAIDAFVRKNGTSPNNGATRITPSGNNSTICVPASDIVTCNGSTDYFEICFRADRSGNGTTSTVQSAFLGSTLCWRRIGS